MNNFDFYSPAFFAFNKEREQDSGALVRRIGDTKVLIHYGRGSVVRSGLLDRVKASLDDVGIMKTRYSTAAQRSMNPGKQNILHNRDKVVIAWKPFT